MDVSTQMILWKHLFPLIWQSPWFLEISEKLLYAQIWPDGRIASEQLYHGTYADSVTRYRTRSIAATA